MNRNIILALITLSLSGAASADDLTGRLGFGGNVGAAIPTGSKWVRDNNDTGVGSGGWIRYGIDRNWRADLAYDHQSFTNSVPGTYLDMLTLSAAYNLDPDWDWNPTIHAGMGPAFVRAVETGLPTQFGFTTGIGLDKFLCRNFSVGTSMDWFYSSKNQSPYHDASALRLGVNVGLWFLGNPEPKPVAAAPAPKLEPVAPPPPPPAPVPAPAPKKVEIALAVEFDTAKSVVKPEYDGQLDKVAKFMKDYPFSRGEIEGHTDSVGSAEYNRGLSQRRADAVRQALIDRFHIDGSRLTAKGYGPDRPIADNKTVAGRAKNRRVVASFEASGQ